MDRRHEYAEGAAIQNDWAEIIAGVRDDLQQIELVLQGARNDVAFWEARVLRERERLICLEREHPQASFRSQADGHSEEVAHA